MFFVSTACEALQECIRHNYDKPEPRYSYDALDENPSFNGYLLYGAAPHETRRLNEGIRTCPRL